MDRHPFVSPLGQECGGRVVQFGNFVGETRRPAAGSDEFFPRGGHVQRVSKLTD